MADLLSNVLAFCALLRSGYDINAGYDRAYEALRAIDVIGISDRERFRSALRVSLCDSFEQIERFDRAFEAFFGTRAQRIRRARTVATADEEAAPTVAFTRPQYTDEPAETSTVLSARYSAAAAQTSANPVLPEQGLGEMLAVASKLIAAVHLGRSRRWRSRADGTRFDFRGTLRSSLHTGGDPARIRMLGHPFRNPRIVMLLDGSRSMSAQSADLLQFAYALCRRSKRARVFAFSTALREITGQLRSLRRQQTLKNLGESWGGGTRIGAALAQFTREYGSRIDADTVVLIASDGFDADEGVPLQHAMRQLRRRSAGIIWLNPHASAPGFDPAARAMKTALPYLSALLDSHDLRRIAVAAGRLRR
jgi:uncharacterized protein